MAATTISDLPRDALVLILRAVLDAAKQEGLGWQHVSDVHQHLRNVSREWRDAADMAYIEHKGYCVKIDFDGLPDLATARFRALLASMAHGLDISCPGPDLPGPCMARITAQALSSLCSSTELRRVLKHVSLGGMKCANEAAAAVSAIVPCSHLTSLELEWKNRQHDHVAPCDVLASLTAWTGLKELSIRVIDDDLAEMWVQATVPQLPYVPSLTSLELSGRDASFAFMASDAALGSLRRLSLSNDVIWWLHKQWASNDPFQLRAGLGAGVWRPHALTSVRKLCIAIECHEDEDEDAWDPRVYTGPVPAAAVWEPLARTVTELELSCASSIFADADMETGMYAGLGALTGLRSLRVYICAEERSPVDFGHVHLPRLTSLSVCDYRGPPIDLARFPRLVHVEIVAKEPEPLAVSSVAELRRLATLRVLGGPRFGRPLGEQEFKPRLNLAQMFGGGRPLAALTGLSFDCVTLSWDAAAAAGAPTASEFAAGAAALLPSLRSVEIKEYVDMDDGVREFVVPAVMALGGG